MQQLRSRLEYYVNLIRKDEPQSSVERIRYIKNVTECCRIIDELFQTDSDYINSLMRGFRGYNEFILGCEKKSLSSTQCAEIKYIFYNKCFMCEFDLDSILTIHHVIPQRLCGKNDESNLISVCPTCHAIFHKIEKLGKMPSDVESFLRDRHLYGIFLEYTKHLIDDKQAYQTAFCEDGLECSI